MNVEMILIIVGGVIANGIALTMMVLTAITCAKKLSPTYHLSHDPTVIRGEILDVIPEGSYFAEEVT